MFLPSAPHMGTKKSAGSVEDWYGVDDESKHKKLYF
jgi:hypothetical protein